ncbi:hypothetical protein [Burkholderia sp. Ax-1719]|uniref:hypothetical protein n=1 Tax=Burkholderia sp. Ax-1719 TaxID=2608334 RepID=UPI0023DBF26C|nr:hypothetical protein [Burkholderia sp. Ax-1719]
MPGDALARYLTERGLPFIQRHCRPDTPIIGSFEVDSARTSGHKHQQRAPVNSVRIFFLPAAKSFKVDHSTHRLVRSAELTTVQYDLRHASVSTTSIYLQRDEVKRARQIDDAISGRNCRRMSRIRSPFFP